MLRTVTRSLMCVSATLVMSLPAAAGDDPPDFEQQIAPLLIKRCVECHNGPKASGSLQLDSASGLSAGGESGAVLDREQPEHSELLRRVREGEMPPEQQGKSQKLPDAEIALLERWVLAGAAWPEDRTLDLFERTSDVRAGRDWWSLRPVTRPTLPDAPDPSGTGHPVDAFVRSRLSNADMQPAPPASPRVLLRRLHFVLTGLPPTAEQFDAFEAAFSPSTVESKIDELLSSPHFGERWARHWLDVARFADTSGYERDQEKRFAWKYRDWVVDAFNADMPYDQFVIHQLAGDEIDDRSESSVMATGFLRLGTWNDEPNDPADYVYDRLEDMVHATSSAFLGMTVKCARCHTHKFDPITQDDYYRLASAFWAGPIQPRDRDLLGGPSAEELGFPDVLGWTDLGPAPSELHVLQNGERHHPLHAVTPATLSMIPSLERELTQPADGAATSRRRLQIAAWIADPRNPLTPRVMVNRLWLHTFGDGIVRSPNNFGFLADPPTHPELLDWLAAEFVDTGWKVKPMLRLLLTSSTFQQSADHPMQNAYAERDSGNRLWWRAARRRVDAEALRDAMLFVSGQLDLQVGGPPFRPDIDPAALEGLSMKSAAWQSSPPEQQRRRSLYAYMKRGLLPPIMTTFDLADTTLPCGQRESTTVPTQSLALLNNPFVHAQSRAAAERVLTEGMSPYALADAVFLTVLGRHPDPVELDLAVQHVDQQMLEYAAATDAAEPQAALSAAASLAHVLMNSNEFLYID